MKTLEAKKRDMEMSLDALRSEGMVPAVVYGGKSETLNITVSEKEVRKIWSHVMKTETFDLDVEGTKNSVMFKDLQTHAVSGAILSIDFMIQG